MRDPARQSLAALIAADRRGKLPLPIHEVLSRYQPDWNARSLDDRWEKSLTQLVAWVTANQRLPIANGYSDDPDERRLGPWLHRQRHDKQLSPARRAELDAKIPTWNRTFASAWDQRLQETLEWVRRNNGLPSCGGPRPGEASTWTWIRVQRERSHLPMQEERNQRLDEVLPGWRGNARTDWNERFSQLSAWVAEKGRLPMRRPGYSAESSLARWVYRQRDLQTDDPHRKQLDEAIPEWDHDRRTHRN